MLAWDQGTTAPDWQTYLEDVAPTELRQRQLRLIKIDLEYRWVKLNEQRTSNFICKPCRNSDNQFLSICYTRVSSRQRVKHDKDARDLLQRFPEHALELRKLIGTQSLKLQNDIDARRKS